MSAYATRLATALGAGAQRVRRWSQGTDQSERPPPPRTGAGAGAGASSLESPIDDDDEDIENVVTATGSGALQSGAATGAESSRTRDNPEGRTTGTTGTTVTENTERTEDRNNITADTSIQPSATDIATPEPNNESPPEESNRHSQPNGVNPQSIPPPTAIAPPEGHENTPPPPVVSTPRRTSGLPEDDGQRQLRLKLSELSRVDISERERAQRMHAIMTEKWTASQNSKNEAAISSAPTSPTLAPLENGDGEANPYKLLPGDDRKTYYTGPGAGEGGKEEELGCSHYRRGVRLQCSTCERWHTCRFCHDEAEDHALIRRETKNMLCMHCGKPQPAKQDCGNCGVRSAKYYCDKCKLWDDDPHKSIYHCNDCGICRIGQGLGKDFFHCKKCGVCMSIALEGSHRCIERSTECDCPICGEFMFTSTQTVVFMTCGHSIHHKCYYEHMKTSYRCPTCARTIINMESQFRQLDVEIDAQPLPTPYDRWRCLISCNDCTARSNVPFHFLGLRCENCRSYNTSQLKILRPEDGVDTEGNVVASGTDTAGDGVNGANGANGANGVGAVSAVNGANGANGVSAVNAVNGVPGVGGVPSLPTSPLGIERVRSIPVIPVLHSPPRAAGTEHGNALETFSAGRAISPGVQVATGPIQGVDIQDDGWGSEEEDDSDFLSERDMEDEDEDDDGLDMDLDEEEEEEEDDEEEEELINLRGHI